MKFGPVLATCNAPASMWLLAKGISADGHVNLRIASLSRGTTIGEMALAAQARRSATIVADEHVVRYEPLRRGC